MLRKILPGGGRGEFQISTDISSPVAVSFALGWTLDTEVNSPFPGIPWSRETGRGKFKITRDFGNISPLPQSPGKAAVPEYKMKEVPVISMPGSQQVWKGAGVVLGGGAWPLEDALDSARASGQNQIQTEAAEKSMQVEGEEDDSGG